MSQTFAKERNFFATTFGAGIKILHIYTANLNFCSKMVYICKKIVGFMRVAYYSSSRKILPLICRSDISQIFVLYCAVSRRSSASKRLCCASRISKPDRSPSI